MSMSTEQVLKSLSTIVHPSSGKDIVSMGLVQQLQVEGKQIAFTLQFPNLNDPVKASVKKACEITLKEAWGADLILQIQINTPMKPVLPKKTTPILPGVKNIIAVSSGKGGVGKSTVATNMAIAFAITGAKVGLIDADIFGPSVPKMLGIENEKPGMTRINDRDMLLPVEKHGIKSLSIGLFVSPEDATIWRGPMASNALKQLLSDTHWGELDYLFVDLPPGTSDIHLTLVQTVAVTGAIIVSTPQAVALADVVKGITMFRNESVNVPVLGLVENMSWFTPEELPDNRYYIFGKEGCAHLAAKTGIPLLGQIPLVQSVCEAGDEGIPVVLRKQVVSEAFKQVAERLRTEIIRRNANQQPTQKVEITHGRKI